MKKDLYFHYKNVGRNILILKHTNKQYNINEISKIKTISGLFVIKSVEDVDNLTISNCFYFLKYIFGNIGIYMNYEYKFSLNISYHSFIIQTSIKKKKMYSYLYLITNDIINMLPKVSIEKKEKDEKTIEYIIKDMHYFIDKNNTIGFYNLTNPVTLRIEVENKKMNIKNILTLFKI